MAIHCNGTELPISISFHSKYRKPVFLEEVSLSIDSLKYLPMPELNENVKLGISFFSDTEEANDENAYIKVQTSLFDEEDMQEEKIIPLSNTRETIEWLYNEDDNEIYPWRMGIYLLEIHYKRNTFVGAFFIKPLHLSKEQVIWIHNFLESKVDRIIYDFVYSKSSVSSSLQESIKTGWYYDYVRYMTSIKEEWLYSLSMIEKHPVEHVVDCYQVEAIQKRQDRKSLHWSMTPKAISRQANGNMSIFMNKKKVTNIHNKENEWIKHIMLQWKYDIQEVEILLRKDYNKLLTRHRDKSYDAMIFEKQRNRLLKQRDVAQSTKKDIESKIKMCNRELSQINQLISMFDKWFHTLIVINSQITYTLQKTFFVNLPRGKGRPFLKKTAYLCFNNMFEETKKIISEKGDKRRYIPILKPTWQIYEYFCLFYTLEILQQLGFSLTEGLTEELMQIYRKDRIPEGCCFTMEDESYLIHIWYDKYHAHSEQEAVENGESFFTHNVKKRPDIKLDLYVKQSHGTLAFRDCLILDAKFRKLSSIYNNKYVNKTTEQLVAYTGFFYCGHLPTLRSPHSTCVNRVMCLYASEVGGEVKEVRRPITFIKLLPRLDDKGNEYVLGSDELKETLQEWLLS